MLDRERVHLISYTSYPFYRGMDIVHRVLNRVRTASLDVGRSVFTDHLKIHRYRESLLITEMTNAGKRGKKVRELSVGVNYMSGDADALLKEATDAVLHENYDQAKRSLEKMIDDGKSLSLNESIKRGVDVEPPGTKINLHRVAPDKRITDITASPHDFHVKDSAPMGGHDEKGEPHFRQDTNYWPVKKQDAISFYTWLKSHLSEAAKMGITDLTKVWDANGINYDSH